MGPGHEAGGVVVRAGASDAGARSRTQSGGVQMTVLVYVLVYISAGVVPACMFILF